MKTTRIAVMVTVAAAVALMLVAGALPAATADKPSGPPAGLTVSMASTRTQFAADEPIELAVLYVNDGGNLKEAPLAIRHTDGSGLVLTVPLDAAVKSQSRIVTIKAGALKPGRYRAMVGEFATGGVAPAPAAAATAGAGVPPPAAAAATATWTVEFAVHCPLHANAYFVATGSTTGPRPARRRPRAAGCT